MAAGAKFDIRQQGVFTSIVTLLVISIVGLCTLRWGNHALHELVYNDSLLGTYIAKFEVQQPLWAALFTTIVIFCTTFWLGRIISVQNIYSRSLSIQLPLSGIFAWSVVLNGESLLSSIISALVLIALVNLLHAARDEDSLPRFFDAALALSIVPLLYSPAMIMWLVVPLSLLVCAVPLRSWIVSLVGLILLPLLTFYIFWLCGEEFLAAPMRIWEQYITTSELLNFREVLLFRTSIITLGVFLSISSVLWIKENLRRTRVRLQIGVIFLLTAIITLAAPSATLLSFCLVTPALGLLTPFTLTRIPWWIVNIFYILLVALLLLALFIPLYLPL